MKLSKLWETVKDREAWHAVVHQVIKNQTRLTEQQKSKKSSVRTICVQIYLGRIDILIILS